MDLSEEYKKAKEEALTRHLLEMEAVYNPAVEALRIHTKALACHCECLGMNAENCHAMCIGKTTPYNNDNYLIVMQKWGLIDGKGNPII